MLLSITTTHRPATDLGYLLHKNPARVQSFGLNAGRAWVFYPEASEERCTCSLLLDLDPVELSRRPRGASTSGFALFPYVNDRPYVASSFMSVALAEVFGSALNGRCRERPELVERPLPLELSLPVVPSRDGEAEIRRLFEPLGYALEIAVLPLDPRFPEWGDSRYFRVTLRGVSTLRRSLDHLYVLLPVLDDHKHYWVGDDEVDKLLRHGEGWLSSHPERDAIVRRYLKHRRDLTDDALARMSGDDSVEDDAELAHRDAEEERFERPIRLHTARLETVRDHLVASGARRVLDLGCGEGKLIAMLLDVPQFEEIVGMDVSHSVLTRAADRLRLETLPPMRRRRVRLLHGSLVYRDRRLAGFDAAALVEVIEHLDPFRLDLCAAILFGDLRPATVVITTPNREYNACWPSLSAGTMRHADHRFEWTREEFRSWCSRIAGEYGYDVEIHPIGEEHAEFGSPTHMGVFTICA